MCLFKRLELIETGQYPLVRYHSFKDNLAEHRDFSPLEFLATLSQHIPDRWEQTTRYMGSLSARTRGAMRLHAPIDNLKELERKPRPSKTWAACMKRIFEIDPLVCPKCTGRMHIKSFIINGSQIERLAKDIGIIPWRAPPAFKPAQTDSAA